MPYESSSWHSLDKGDRYLRFVGLGPQVPTRKCPGSWQKSIAYERVGARMLTVLSWLRALRIQEKDVLMDKEPRSCK